MKWLATFLVLAVAACSSGPAPSPQSPPTPSAEAPQPPGYLGLGLTYHEPDPQEGSTGWLMVRYVPEDGPAFRAGLEPQMVITAIDGRPLTFPDDASMLLWVKSIRPGQSIRLTLGGHEPRELTLVAAEMPPDKLRIWKANFEPAPPKPPSD